MKRFLILLALAGSLLWAQKPDPKAIIGKIDDKVYTYAEYETILSDYFKHFNPTHKKLSVEEQARLNDQCWEELIGRYVYDQAIKAGKIKLTNAQVLAEAKKNPPAAVKQIKDLQTKGKFDKQKYLDALNHAPEFKKAVIAEVRALYQYTKLLDTIKAEVDISADSVKAKWFKDNDTVDARIIYFDYHRLTEVVASEDEARRYYEERKDEFKKEDGRSLRYVKFSKTPSAADSLAARQEADRLYEELLAGRDFAIAAQELSQDPGSGQNGGSLGWFGRGRMVKPFEETAFSTPIGVISRPVLSNFGWHIIKVTGRREGQNGEEVEASHILLSVNASEKTLQDYKINSARLHAEAQQRGLEKAANELGFELNVTPVFFAKEGFIPDIGREAKLITFAYENPPNTLSDIYYASSGDAYVIETAEQFPVWYPDFETEKANFINRATTTKRMYTMSQIAEGYISELKPTEYLSQADQDSLTVIQITGHKDGDTITSIGKVEELNAALFATPQGQFTPLIKNNNRWFLAFIDKRSKPDIKAWEKLKTKEIASAREELRKQHLNNWYASERKKVSIIDNRADYYDLSSTRKMIKL